jgi:soluble lytic murein transglycosylase
MMLKKKKSKRILRIVLIIIVMVLAAVTIESGAKKMFPQKYGDYVYMYSEMNSIDPNLVFAVIKAESSFNTMAVSSRDARGLMQITESTGQWGADMLDIKGYSMEMLFDPETNIKIGCWYINTLMKEFDYKEELVIAAYNAGSGNVRKWLSNSEYSSSGELLDKIPYGETERYLHKVRNYYAVYRNIYG